jgi:hypothetical protein
MGNEWGGGMAHELDSLAVQCTVGARADVQGESYEIWMEVTNRERSTL